MAKAKKKLKLDKKDLLKKAGIVLLLVVALSGTAHVARNHTNQQHLDACKEIVGAQNPLATPEQVDQFCRDHIRSVTGSEVLPL